MTLTRAVSNQTRWNALIRTHHITSRKKVAKVKQAASSCEVSVLLRSGGCPGIMYVEGPSAGVENWVESVQKLRYKDFQLAARPAAMELQKAADPLDRFEEIASVKEFGAEMQHLGVLEWWRKAMGYSDDGNRM